MGQWWTLGKLVQIIAILPCSNMRHIIKTGEHTLIHKHHHSKNIGNLPCIQIVQYVFRVFSYVPIFLWVFVFSYAFPRFFPLDVASCPVPQALTAALHKTTLASRDAMAAPQRKHKAWRGWVSHHNGYLVYMMYALWCTDICKVCVYI